MGLKSVLTPLEEKHLLPASKINTLKLFGITTVEELVGTLESDPESIASILRLDDEEIEELERKSNLLLNPQVAEEMERQRTIKYFLGARDPQEKK